MPELQGEEFLAGPAAEAHEGGVPAARVSRSPLAADVDPRILAAWREWLAALATDAEAAIAAAHVYAELAPDARDAWLDALAEDAPKLAVPAVAIYAPVLSVEAEPSRRARIERAMGEHPAKAPRRSQVRALRGLADDGTRVVTLTTPLYLSFVQVLSCRYHPDAGFVWVWHDPILRRADAPCDGGSVEGVHLEATPLTPVVEELAHAVLAHRRRGEELPSPLRMFAYLFDAEPEAEPFPLIRRLSWALAFAAVACGGAPPAPETPAAPVGERVEFDFVTLSGAPLSTASISGRITVIGFVATYDLPSVAQARYLNALAHNHKPRVNVAVLILEPEENRPLVEAFAKTLRLSYPLAFADQATVAGRGPFAGLHHVPSVVILDREGRERWRNVGLVDEATIDEAVRTIERTEQTR